MKIILEIQDSFDAKVTGINYSKELHNNAKILVTSSGIVKITVSCKRAEDDSLALITVT